MRIGYNGSTAIKRSNLELDLEMCEKYGFDFMELRVSIVEDYFKRGGTVENIKEFFKKSRLKPHAMNSLEFFNMKSPQEFKKIKLDFDRMCRLTSNLGSDLVIVVPSRDIEADADTIEDNTVTCLKEFSDIAAEYGLRVGFEFVGFPNFSVNNFTRAYDIVRKVDRKNVGSVIDLYHFYINGSSIEDLEKARGEKIFMVHINDAESRPVGSYDSDAYRLMPGDGVIPYSAIFKALNDINYNGIMSIELFNADIWEWDPETAIRTAKEKCDEVINKYWNGR